MLERHEHLLDSCVPLARGLLEKVPELSIVATSREAWRITGEAVFRVPRLTLPPAGEDDSGLPTCDAVRLFAERAAAISSAFALTRANVTKVG